jgi:hypothetical protein
MIWPRLSVAGSMALVALVGFGLAAPHNADPFWASASFTIALGAFSIAPVGAFSRRGRARATWASFAIFGWAHLLVPPLPARETGGFRFGPIPWPHSLIKSALAGLQPSIMSVPSGISPAATADLLVPYDQVAHSLGVILFGLVGAALARLVVAEGDREDRRSPPGS